MKNNLAISNTSTENTENIASLPLLNLNSSRDEIFAYFNNTWQLTEALFSSFTSDEVFYKTPDHKLRHPTIFYYAHPAVVYVNKLLVAGVIDKPVDQEMELLFETGVDEMRWDNINKDDKTVWPDVEKVIEYREKVYAVVKDIIFHHKALDNMPVTMDHPMWALVMGFEHERIHLETSSVLFREMPVENFKQAEGFPDVAPLNFKVQKNEMIKLENGQVKLGKPRNHPSFGWDNEYGAETRDYKSFSASKYLISNSEFLEFVKDGGYREEKFWSNQGWEWRKFNNTKWPRFWVQDGPAGSHIFKLRTIFQEIEMQDSWPAIVNFHEAKAYCKWYSAKKNVEYKLLTEAEHNAIRDGNEEPHNLEYSSEHAVGSTPANDKGFYDVFGNVWQWCEDYFHPLAGSQPHPYYDDFSAPCYDNEHHMILGGSFISTGDEASKYARFHFRPHFYQHAGFRIVRCEDKKKPDNKYEDEEVLASYLLLGFGTEEQVFDKINKPEILNLTDECVNLAKKHSSEFNRVLDLGSAVGATAFELSKHFDKVVGVEYSDNFVRAAKQIQQDKEFEFFRKETGDEGTNIKVQLDDSIDTSKVHFEQGDACDLKEDLKGFDAVVLANVICRLPDIPGCLRRMGGKNALVNDGGVLVITSPYSWFEEYSQKDNWVTENPVQHLGKLLPEFEFVEEKEIPFMIREHSRKFEYIVTHATVWKKKSS